ncbi:MAG: hypothetical protein QNJ70_27040 [Xenococcaceae cyanobacterium MO_207.B15]|nr:hypothetical protein [Xenococcaceae cyanobacterium MO_207.B15]MDJ0745206.1 hypothetical protein [Xenococcaceae cyanobacterium MO_167.B27]
MNFNSQQQQLIKIVEEELKHPTLGVTEQILEVHQIIYESNQPVIARIDDKREKEAFYIYLRLKEQPYYFVIIIRTENNQLAVSASYIEPEVRVYLSVKSKQLTAQEITNELTLH